MAGNSGASSASPTVQPKTRGAWSAISPAVQPADRDGEDVNAMVVVILIWGLPREDGSRLKGADSLLAYT